MRYILRFAFVVVVVTLAWNWWWANFERPAARQRTDRLMTLRVQALAPSPPMTVTVSEGYAVQVQWSEGNVLNRFALRAALVDAGSVRVAVESPHDGRVLGEVALNVGAPPRATETTPPFSVQVVRVEER